MQVSRRYASRPRAAAISSDRRQRQLRRRRCWRASRGAATFGLSVAGAVAETGWLPARVQQLAAELKQAGLDRDLRQCADHIALAGESSPGRADRKSAGSTTRIRLQPGINKEQLRERTLGPDELSRRSRCAAAREEAGSRRRAAAAAGRGVVLRDEEAESKAQIEQAFAKAG